MSAALKVPFADLRRATAAARPELDAAIAGVLDRGWYVLGCEGASFEEELAAHQGGGYAVGVGSGTDAIELALRAVDVGPGDDVVTQANTCIPTIAAIERAGATPVLCDADVEIGTMDPASLAAAVTPSTKAIVPVHLYGQVGDLAAVLDVAADRGVAVIEDCAQAIGAGWRGRRAGSIGHLGAFSFYPTKNLGALGDGGAVVTDDEDLAERLRRLRVYGERERYVHVEPGVNSRLDELQAAILRVRLRHLYADNERRRSIADAYDNALAGTPVAPLARNEDAHHVFHLYVARAPGRDAFREALSEAGVGTLVHYPHPVHHHPPYRALGEGVPLANAERLCAEIVSLPMYPELTDAEVDHVCAAARAASFQSQ